MAYKSQFKDDPTLAPQLNPLKPDPEALFFGPDPKRGHADARSFFASRSPAFKMILWSSFALFCLIFFTILKLPEDRIKVIVESHLNSVLGQKGIVMTSETGKLSFLFGIKYTFKGVLLNLPMTGLAPLRFSRIEMAPSFSRLWLGQIGVKLKLVDIPDPKPGHKKGEQTLEVFFSQRKNQMSLSFQAKKFPLEKIGFFPLALGIQVAVQLDGRGKLEGDWTHLSSLDGTLKVHLEQLLLEAQNIEGFNLPKIALSSSDVSLVIKKGKGTVQELRLGRKGLPDHPDASPEDLQGNITGSFSLMDKLESSQLNLKTTFSISENVMKSFVLLDVLLGAGKQPDGTYGFELTGPIDSINAQPISTPQVPSQEPGK